jgi:hypothetical protein
MVRIKAENIKDYTAKDYNTKNTIKVIIKTKPEKNIISTIRKDISL